MLKNVKLSTRKIAKDAGFAEKLFLCRKHVAVLFGVGNVKSMISHGSILQTVPANYSHIFDLPAVRGSRRALANAAGILRSALSAGRLIPGLSKLMRCLTEHEIILYYRDRDKKGA